MPAELFDGVFDITCLAGMGRIRAYLFDDEVPTLVDTGLADTTEALLDGIEETGVTPDRLVLTHGDPDHAGGATAVVDAYDVSVWLPAAVSEKVAHLDADRHYGDGDRVGAFEAVHLPGHTPGSSALIDEERGIAVFGDALVGADWRNLPAGYLTLPPALYSVDLLEAERSLEKLLSYSYEAGLVFHGTSVTEGASAQVERYVEYDGKPDGHRP